MFRDARQAGELPDRKVPFRPLRRCGRGFLSFVRDRFPRNRTALMFLSPIVQDTPMRIPNSGIAPNRPACFGEQEHVAGKSLLNRLASPARRFRRRRPDNARRTTAGAAGCPGGATRCASTSRRELRFSSLSRRSALPWPGSRLRSRQPAIEGRRSFEGTLRFRARRPVLGKEAVRCAARKRRHAVALPQARASSPPRGILEALGAPGGGARAAAAAGGEINVSRALSRSPPSTRRHRAFHELPSRNCLLNER